MSIVRLNRWLWVTCSILAVVLVLGVQPGYTQGSVSGPMLTLDRSAYCIGESWTLDVANAPVGMAIRLIGASNGVPWEVPDWAMTNQNGRYSESGTFGADNQGLHRLYMEIGGINSNTVSFIVSDSAGTGCWDY